MTTIEQTIEELEIARNYVKANGEELRRRYGADYIAVLSNKVVDNDKEEFALAERMERNYRDKSVLVGTIEGIVSPIKHELPSPEVER